MSLQLGAPGKTARAGATTDGLPAPVGRRRRGRWFALAALLVAVAATLWLLLGQGSEERRAGGPRGGATATVARQTLVEREDVEGTLGYSGKRTVEHRSESSAASGASPPTSSRPDEDQPEADATPTLTAVAAAGSIVRRGGVLYRASGQPVVLMYGSTPAYRSLSSGGDEGRDVLQLERNLAALGLGAELTVDEDYTAATAAAVRDWQEALGVEETGEVELGQVVFLPSARRMGAPKTPVGSLLGAGAEVVATTSTERVVSVELEASNQSLAREGGRVTVTLPDGRSVNGRISSVGRVAREQESEETGGLGGDGGSGEPVIDVTVKLIRTRGIGRLDEAPVTVGLARESRKGVLAVPVTALLARTGGGYAVELMRGGSRRRVRVETGLFATGFVEVSGRGIAEGVRVAVPE